MKNKTIIKYFIYLTILFTVFEYSPSFAQFIGNAQYTTTSAIENYAKEQLINNDNIIFSKVPRGLVISIATKDIFPDGGITIKDSAYPLLYELGKIIKHIGNPCVIEGNALTQKEYNKLSNIELSIIRADEIVSFLIKKCNISPNSIRAIGFGDIMPFDDNVSYKNHLDKRIDFVILNYEANR